MITEGLWRPDLRRRATGVEDGRRRRRSSRRGVLEECANLLMPRRDPCGPCEGVPGFSEAQESPASRNFSNPTHLRRRGPREIPGEVRVMRGYKGLGRLPGTMAKLLRGLWELAVQRSGVLTAEQGRGETEQRGGGGARVCGEAAADEGVGRGHGGQIKPEPRPHLAGISPEAIPAGEWSAARFLAAGDS